ncbi:Hydantoinase/oxoprolinase N-terminal region [Microdochium nivale]|nr:Hydantoinase/oxoprolinase N-terminal region [Microdochium nivale]
MATNTTIARGTLLNLEPAYSIHMGTAVATNALLARQGGSVAFLTTKGLGDGLLIGNQIGPDLFDLSVRRLGQLYETVVEFDEHVTIENASQDPEPSQPVDYTLDPNLVMGQTGEVVRILKRPDLDSVRRNLELLKTKDIVNVAICFMHSYTFPDHEV